MRRTGPADISYCNTNCCQENCKRNLRYWKPPTKFYSVSNFDEDCKNAIHSNCEHKWLAEEKKK